MMEPTAPLDLMKETSQDMRQRIFTTLKVDINEFLFPRLPDTMTLGDFEEMACQLYKVIQNKW